MVSILSHSIHSNKIFEITRFRLNSVVVLGKTKVEDELIELKRS